MVRVNVSEGILEGEVVENEFGGTFYSFKGIPYAQPPIGDLRFKAPQPPKSWAGVRSAKQFGSACIQFDAFTNMGIYGTEDCLYLNVYTPNVKPDKPLPVMFYIHGGAFVCGSGDDDLFGPELLLKDEVIVVTFNYRLEVLGFLCLESKDVPGNAGMKDQVQALRWVNKNISNFGGDPNNITIFGCSAGAGSVSYHLVSPMTKGLFQRAYAMSGSILCPWAKAYKPRERALALAKQLGCFSEDDTELYEFFKNQPTESLIGTSVPLLLSEQTTLTIYFSIVQEKSYGDNEIYFAGDFGSVHDGVEVVVGYTSDEGLIIIKHADNVKPKLEMARHYAEFFSPKLLAFDLTSNQKFEIGKRIRKYYFNDIIDIPDSWEQLSKFYGMEMFVHGVISFAKLCAKKKSKVYLHRFSCKSERNIIALALGLGPLLKNKQVTCHADDQQYSFNGKLVPNKIDQKSETFQLMQKVTKLWTNFAKYGNPTPDESLGVKWPNYTVEKQDYLEIGNEFVPGTAPDGDEVQFWDDIFEECGHKLY